jgi:hypothetical protein
VAKRKRIEQKTVRTSMDAVTGKLETVILDDVHNAYEVCVRVIEGQMKKLSVAPKCERLARKLLERVRLMLPKGQGEAA